MRETSENRKQYWCSVIMDFSLCLGYLVHGIHHGPNYQISIGWRISIWTVTILNLGSNSWTAVNPKTALVFGFILKESQVS